MALRFVARKLRIPIADSLQRASSARLSSATGSLASRSSQNGGARRAMNGTKNGRQVPKDLDRLEKRIMLEWEKDKQKLEELSVAIDNLPRNIALTCAGGTLLLTVAWAYLTGAFDKTRKYPE